MSETDRPTTRTEDEQWDWYGSVSDCTGRLLVYDLENPDAWVRSDAFVDLAEHR